MIVVDCSAIVHALTAETLDERLVDRLESEPLHAPHLLDCEVVHALRGLLLGQKIDLSRAEAARSLYNQMPITRYPVTGLSDRVWNLRHTMTAYDASYVALAEALSCPVVTRDGKLARGGHKATVQVYRAPDGLR